LVFGGFGVSIAVEDLNNNISCSVKHLHSDSKQCFIV